MAEEQAVDVRNRARPVKLNVGRMLLAEFSRSIHVASPEKGVTLEQMKDPSFWGHVANKLKPHDRIEAVAEDGEFFVEFIVLSCGVQWAKVAVLRFVELNAEESPDSGDKYDQTQIGFNDYTIEWGGNTEKFRVIRKSDNETVHKGSTSKQAAGIWLTDYIKALGK